MAYRVSIATRAERDLSALFDEIHAGSSVAAQRWYEGLKQAILGLEGNPHVWPATYESPRLRNVLYGRKPHNIYRVIYRILEKQKTVEILHIRHGARSRSKMADLK